MNLHVKNQFWWSISTLIDHDFDNFFLMLMYTANELVSN